MRKTLLFLTSLLLLIASCTQDELGGIKNPEQATNQSNKIRWYGVKLSNDPQTRGVAEGAKLWNQNAGIYIKFLNTPSDPQMLETVKQIASEWEDYAGIKFHFVDQSKDTPVRIAFDWNGNDWLTWSYTGTDAKYERAQSQPTAVLAGVDYLTEEELRSDVLRLFGQILGLEYEQRHQEWSQNGYWRSESQLRSYWENQFDGMNMDWDEIREYVFVPFTEANALHLFATDEIDELSIMVWPYYNRQQTTKLLANYELSDGDKEFIAELYPPAVLELPTTIQEAWVDAGYFVWTDSTKTALRITPLGEQQSYLPDVCDGEQLTSAESMFVPLVKQSRLRKAPMFNTCNITNFSFMFYNNGVLTEIPLYDTSNGTDFNYMFSRCYSLSTIPLLDTSNGTDFSGMFDSCSSLTSIPYLNTSNGINFQGMFGICSSLTSIPCLDTSNGTDFSDMFFYCSSLTSIPCLDTSNGTNFSSIFSNCSSLTSIPHLDTSNGTNFGYMFSRCYSLTTIPHLDTSNGTDFSYMFSDCSSLLAIPLLDTSNGTDFYFIFTRCYSLTSIPHFDTANGTGFMGMFCECRSLTSIPLLDTSNGTNFSLMFYKCSSLTTMPQLDLSNAINTDDMFTGTPFV
ncbi:BspA family leucine-rich repeat surface protein [Bacteroides sp. UBA939]|uniref:BspA family leucine-rich repeat surface protein n=1 Tax=Bacteroides sp. UBA939 TaxID=1946092 RepID=UPI0025C3C23A|nr:BspA family leucine-rich repeat surface protein [Bacteroides sp. UBA939]